MDDEIRTYLFEHEGEITMEMDQLITNNGIKTVQSTGGCMMIGSTIKEFTEKFLKPPKGDSPEQIEARIRHWVDVANHPEAFVNGDKSQYSISAKRRSALQNLRRVLKRHPDVAKAIMQESETKQ